MIPTTAGRFAGRLAVFLPAFLAPSAVALAAAARSRYLLPVLATAAIYPFMAQLILRGRRVAAAGATLLWAASLSASVILLAARDPAGTEGLVIHGATYRDEMFAFIRSGAGRESDATLFLPQHLLHLGAFALLAAASGGILGMALGAVMVGYMSYYVGALAAAGGAPGIALALGWPPWAILRVAGYVLLGIAVAQPGIEAAARRRRARRSGLALPALPPAGPAWYLAALGLLLLDAALKALLAPAWAALLRPCLGG
ncbi:MAG: hypothetical protein HY510_02685 [Acidobacteria bacterium]|nr:hypothetical protein [Acidobacteriota bacterium]